MRGALLVVFALSRPGPARAEPTSCRAIHPVAFAQFSSYAQHRFNSGAEYEAVKPADWKHLVVTVVVDRAPHIARAVLAECPGIQVTVVRPIDAKRQTSLVTITATAFAPLSRLAQLPAVRAISVTDPRRHFDFSEGLE